MLEVNKILQNDLKVIIFEKVEEVQYKGYYLVPNTIGHGRLKSTKIVWCSSTNLLCVSLATVFL